MPESWDGWGGWCVVTAAVQSCCQGKDSPGTCCSMAPSKSVSGTSDCLTTPSYTADYPLFCFLILLCLQIWYAEYKHDWQTAHKAAWAMEINLSFNPFLLYTVNSLYIAINSTRMSVIEKEKLINFCPLQPKKSNTFVDVFPRF